MKKGTTLSKTNTKVPSSSAFTPDEIENEMIALSINLVRQRLIDGTATSQETTHFLKLATRKAKLEQEILEKQADLIDAKAEMLRSAKNAEELYANAMKAFRSYTGQSDTDDE